MKKSVKALLTVLCAIVLVVATVLGTLAYMTDRSTVTNTFTVGKVDITVDEAPVDENGKKTTGDRVTQNSYKLIPGKSYDKDPTMTVTKGSEECYVRMVVKITGLTNLSKALDLTPETFMPGDYVTGWNPEIWTIDASGISVNGDVGTYTFYYKDKVNALEATEDVKLPALFETIVVPGDKIDSDELAALNGLKIEVDGHAIQAETFNTKAEAWAAFDAQYPSTPANP